MTKYKRLVMIVMILCLSQLISGEHGDVGALSGLEPAGHYQGSVYTGQKDSVQVELRPIQQLLPSRQPNPQPTTAVKDKDDSSVYSKVITSGVMQARNNDRREKSQQNLIDHANDSVFLETNIISSLKTDLKLPNSLADQDDSGIEGTEIGQVAQPQSNSGVSDSLADFGTKTTNQQKQSDESSGPDGPILMQVTVSDRSLKREQNPRNNALLSIVNDSILQDSQNKSDQYNIDENEEDDASYGNPPVLLDSDKLDTVQKTASALSSEEREKLRTETAENLDLSAIDPGLALLPSEHNFQTLMPEGMAVPSTFTTSSTTESGNSLQDQSLHNGSNILNIINNIVETDLAEETQVNSENNTDSDSRDGVTDFGVPESNRESYGRKVLNEDEEDLDYIARQNDEYEINIDNYFYEYFDEDEDDYVGGEVLGTVSSKDKAGSLIMDQTKNVAKKKLDMTKDHVANSDDLREDQQPDNNDRTGYPGELNFDQAFSYDDDDSDWYYDPEDTPDVKETEDLIVTPISTSRSNHNIPFQDKNGAANGNPSESKTEITAPDLKDRLISQEDLHVKRALQGPKGTIILYTALIIVLIACIMLFSVWKSPFQNGRPIHQPTIVQAGEEGKRLLDHPFV